MSFRNKKVLLAVVTAVLISGCSSSSKTGGNTSASSSSSSSTSSSSSSSSTSSSSGEVSTPGSSSTSSTSSSSSSSSASGSSPGDLLKKQGSTLTFGGADTSNVGDSSDLLFVEMRENVGLSAFILMAADNSFSVDTYLAEMGEFSSEKIEGLATPAKQVEVLVTPNAVSVVVKKGSELWRYGAICSGSACDDKMSVSLTDRTITFTGLPLDAVSSNATEKLIINGTITWLEKDEAAKTTPINSSEYLTSLPLAEVAQLTGLWDGSHSKDGTLDEVFYQIEDGNWYFYDYMGDETDNGDNCYLYGGLIIEKTNTGTIKLSGTSGEIEFPLYVSDEGFISEFFTLKDTDKTVSDFKPLCTQ